MADAHKAQYCGPEESLWSRFLKNGHLSHGQCKKDLDGYNSELFVQIFAFWKLFFIIFFLLLIGLLNLGLNWDKTVQYMRDNQQTFFLYEFLLLFAAFFVSTIFMYLFRIQTMPLGVYNIFMITFVITVFCVLKHVAFEMSGIYRFNFGNKTCKEKKKKEKEKEEKEKEEEMKLTDEEKKQKEEDKKIKKESMTEEEKKKEKEEEEEKKKCKCDDGPFTGPFWNGLGYYGMGLTLILIIFFGMSVWKPDGWTKSLFNYQFERYQSILYLILGIGLPFAIGCLLNNIYADKTRMNDCPKDENYIFTCIKNGCACVSIAFMAFITFLLPISLILWSSGRSLDKILTKDNKLEKNNTEISSYYNCSYKPGFNLKRFGLILIECGIMWLIFVFAEAGIKSLRTGEYYLDILKSHEFWEHSAIFSLPTIVLIQIFLEYSDWYKSHLFDYDQIKQHNCTKANKVAPAPAQGEA